MSIPDKILVKFEGELYDLSEFDHPGGNTIIGILRNLDVTTIVRMFHSSIPWNQLRKQLQAYKIPVPICISTSIA